MFENLILEPIADGGKSNQISKTRGEFFVSSSNGALLLDALEKVFDMMPSLVVPFVKRDFGGPVGLGWDTGFEAERFKQRSETVAVVGFVGENGAADTALNQFGSSDQIVSIAFGKDKFDGASAVVDQGMNLGIGSSPGCPNALVFIGLSCSESVFVNFGTGRIDRPEFAGRPGGELIENALPNPRLAPLLPASVNGGVRGKNAQRSPRASLAKPIKKSLQDFFGRDRRSTAFASRFKILCTPGFGINFFSRLALAASFG